MAKEMIYSLSKEVLDNMSVPTAAIPKQVRWVAYPSRGEGSVREDSPGGS